MLTVDSNSGMSVRGIDVRSGVKTDIPNIQRQTFWNFWKKRSFEQNNYLKKSQLNKRNKNARLNLAKNKINWVKQRRNVTFSDEE